ncbi:Protein TANC2 [Geodia barretti]|uniref:Protein TANC2 n=1 Tax=Geodia barretti TaxID=519541 RepID=A0AA35TP36_GEOBA|nr:Protein TANC2 [Geodia barretti]CAI8051570.1 Protein TANC2 [Geodia barretti]
MDRPHFMELHLKVMWQIVRLLLEKRADVSICDKNGCSPVYGASQNGHTDVVDLLVQAGADIHLATTEYGSVPLGIAAAKGHTETVQRLLELGANPNHQNKVITDCHIIIVDYTHTTRL